jgi:P27 family predicted phage terminase small subunit
MSRPVPLPLKLLRGNPGKQALHPEVQPTIPDAVPGPPAFLNGDARQEWVRAAPDLHRLGMLTVLDLSVFGAYCQSFGRWMEFERDIAAMRAAGAFDQAMQLVPKAERAAADMVRYAGEFGMSPVARTKLAGSAAAARKAAPSKFAGLISDRPA